MTAPRVSCLCTAHDVAAYVGAAIESVLAQQGEIETEIVVVDDGSTDGTAHELRRFGSRIRLISQANSGFIGAVNAGLEQVRGEYVALLDGDDEWTPGKVRAQVEQLDARPELGLVHGDMEIVDGRGRLVHPSFFSAVVAPPGRGDVFGALVRANFVSGGSTMFRRSFLPALHPIPSQAAVPDWWIAVRVAELAHVDHLEQPVNRYRRHASNMSASRATRLRNEVRFRHWILRRLAHSRAPLPDLMACLRTLDEQSRLLEEAGIAHGPAAEPDNAAAAATRAEHALAAGLQEHALRHALRALGHDRGCGPARGLLDGLSPYVRPRAPTRPASARSLCVLAAADDLLAEPARLRAYGEAFGAHDPVTLVVCAPGWEPARLERELSLALETTGMGGARGPDVLALPVEPAHVAADAVYRLPTDLTRLRALAATPPLQRGV